MPCGHHDSRTMVVSPKQPKSRCGFFFNYSFPILEVENQWLCDKLNIHSPEPQIFHFPWDLPTLIPQKSTIHVGGDTSPIYR